MQILIINIKHYLISISLNLSIKSYLINAMPQVPSHLKMLHIILNPFSILKDNILLSIKLESSKSSKELACLLVIYLFYTFNRILCNSCPS